MAVPQFQRKGLSVGYESDDKTWYVVIFIEESTELRYKNHRGEIATRHILPLPIPPRKMPPNSDIHPGKWVIEVWDLDKDAQRSYCLEDICNLKEEGQ
jgi:hypothetical protein